MANWLVSTISAIARLLPRSFGYEYNMAREMAPSFSEPLDPQTAAPEARQIIRTALQEWDMRHLIEDAELGVSELAANAVLHGRPPFELVVTRWGDCVRVTMLDTGGGVVPVDNPPRPPTAVGGSRSSALWPTIGGVRG